ncbi:MAG TPA: hypothetical protein VM536_06685, partial [Chloroflexia bacterium]|nr:hypothetical protein [Chloroflexia bacterium]
MAGASSAAGWREARALVRILRSGAPLVVFGLALLIVGLAYQERPTYRLMVGSQTDRPFWRGVNDGERVAGQTYRWTGPTSTLTLPGIGAGAYEVRLELNGGRPDPYAPPEVVVSGGGAVLAQLTPTPGRQSYTVAVPSNATTAGDLRLTLVTRNPFSPPADGRVLGVVLSQVDVVPVGRDLALPPLATWLLLALAAALATAVLGTAGWSVRAARAGGLLWAAGEAAFLLFDRLWLTLIPGTLVGVLLGAGALLLVLGPLWRRLYCAGGIMWPEGEQRGLLAIFAAAFVARLAGQLHPQTQVIDLIFHAHRFEQVLSGQLLFTIPSDEWGGRQTFYLPTPYVLMAPLQWLLRDELLTIRLFTVTLDTLGVFLAYYLARRAFGDGRAGIIAALLQVTFPLAVLPYSWGITANLFGQFVSLAAVAVAVGAYERLTRPGPWLLLTGVVTLAALSHPGNVQLIALLLSGMWVAWGIQAWRGRGTGQGGNRRPWWAFTAALATAAAIAWFSYYTH